MSSEFNFRQSKILTTLLAMSGTERRLIAAKTALSEQRLVRVVRHSMATEGIHTTSTSAVVMIPKLTLEWSTNRKQLLILFF